MFRYQMRSGSSRVLIVAMLLLSAVVSRLDAATVGEDGLHKQDWFSITFRDIGEDIADAADQNKRLVLVFEQRGCIYCKKMHEVLLADPAVSDYIREHYMVVQYNLFGDEEVIDVDGESLTEKTAAERWALLFTPTVLFMPESLDGVETTGKTARDVAVAIMPGAPGKNTFLNMFRWVQEKGYEGDEHFQKYHARKLAEDGVIGSGGDAAQGADSDSTSE